MPYTLESNCNQCGKDLGDSSARICDSCFEKHVIPVINDKAKILGWCNRVLDHMVELSRSQNVLASSAIARMIMKALIRGEGDIKGGGRLARNFLKNHSVRPL